MLQGDKRKMYIAVDLFRLFSTLLYDLRKQTTKPMKHEVSASLLPPWRLVLSLMCSEECS